MTDPWAVYLDRLDALAQAATPAPWRGDRYDGTVKYGIYGPGGGEEALVLQCDHKNADSGFLGPHGEDDERFVLLSRTALPTLVAAVRRLRAVMGRASNWTDIDEALALSPPEGP